MPYINEHSVRLFEPDLCINGSFVRVHGGNIDNNNNIVRVPKSIDIIFARKKSDNQIIAQSLRFNIDSWSIAKVKKWLRDNNIIFLKIEQSKSNNMSTWQFKNMESKVSEIEKMQGIVKVYVNSFNREDSDGDISAPFSFNKTIVENLKRIKWFINHNTSKLLGVPLEFMVDDFGLLATLKFNMEKQLAKDTLTDYLLYNEYGRTLEHSIGFNILSRDKNNPKIITEYKLWEVSTLTNWGANEFTPLVSAKNNKDFTFNIDEINEYFEMLKTAIDLDYSSEKLATIETNIKEIDKIIQFTKNKTTEPIGAENKDSIDNKSITLSPNEIVELFSLKF